MHYFNLLSNDDVSQNRKSGEDRWKSRLSIDDEKRNMVDLQAVCQVANASSSFVCMGDNDYFVTAIDEFGRELVNMALNAPWLRKKEIADHGNVVWHVGGLESKMLSFAGRYISSSLLI